MSKLFRIATNFHTLNLKLSRWISVINISKVVMSKICAIVFFITFFNYSATANDKVVLRKVDWAFDGIFGKFDRQSAQRGAQVYFEVCAACHGLKNLYYRNLKDLGFSDEEIKKIASNYSVMDGPNDSGEMFERPALMSDRFVQPYQNEEAAKFANNGAYPVDLSLITKARSGGADYVFSILTGYEVTPYSIKMRSDNLHYNKYFEGYQIAMPAPLHEDQVQYIDGTKASVDQMAKDVVTFLQWSAEPEMEHRKSLGLKVFIFLSILFVVSILLKKKIWAKIR